MLYRYKGYCEGVNMIKGPFGQARCIGCKSWHFAIQLDEELNPTEYKCCRCGRLIPARKYKLKEGVENEKK